jgi:CDP-glucose 4,6-dehydratase
MDGLGVTIFGDVYKNRRVLITGHTGFKGSWLALWLKNLGAKITGLALAPNSTPSHWDLLNLDIDDRRVDVRDFKAVSDTVNFSSPEIVFHLAAQPLVRRSYKDPLKTWSTNVIGTANILEACRKISGLRAIVVITTDKCYENQNRELGYREDDRLGGRDPYSASKASAELVVSSYRDSFFDQNSGSLLASARAGNVIGGGDWSEDRLIPDLVRAIDKGEMLKVRYPKATRPWQHVLEPLSGYLCLGQKLLEGKKEFAEAWNFGPDDSGNLTVEMVLSHFKELWSSVNWQVIDSPQLHEEKILHLNSNKSFQQLNWKPVWSFQEGLSATAEWYKANLERNAVLSFKQLQDYEAIASQLRLKWIRK